MPPALKNVLLFAVVAVLCLLALEPLTRLFLDTGKLYEVEMWKYATRVKERDHAPDIGHRHRPNAHAILMGEDVDARRSFITRNAKDVRFLDV